MDETLMNEYLTASQSLKDLGIQSEFDFEELIVENNSDIDLNVDYKYLIFKRDDLIRAINLCCKIVQTKSEVSSYNSISFIPNIEHNTLYFCATNDLSHFRYSTELLGDKSNMLDFNICIPLTILQKLVKLMGNKVLLYKKEDNLYIRLLDGDLLLDVRQPNLNIVNFPGTIGSKVADLNLNTIGSTINAFIPLLNSEVRGDYKRISFLGELAYYNSSFYYIQSNITTPLMSLSYRDADFINRLYKYYKDTQISLFNVHSEAARMYLRLDNIEYQFINSVGSISTQVPIQMENLIKDIEATIDFNRFYRVISLGTSLPYATGNIILKYDDNKLIASISSTRGNSDFNFILSDVKELLYNKEVILNAETLKRLLSSFNSSDKIGIALSDTTVTFEYKNLKAVLMNLEQ